MRRAGFTLIELLMVISIIAVLAALLVPIISIAKAYSREAKCRSQIATIQSSLELYKNANGYYPEKYIPTTGGIDVYASVFKATAGNKTADTVTAEGGWERIADALLIQLQSAGGDNFRDLKALSDPFTGGGVSSKVFRYRPAKYYHFVKDSPLAIDGDGQLADGSQAPPNPDTYQLWSAGPDGKDQYGERVNNRKSDDVTNWKTP